MLFQGFTITKIINFRWDEVSRQKNLEKHGLDFIDAVWVLENPYRLDIDSVRGGKLRMQSFSYVFAVLTVLTMVHTEREDTLRIISFRPAGVEERSVYHDWFENDFHDAS